MKLKQEMLHILTIAVREMIHACIRNLKYVITRILSGSSINANLGYFVLINVECRFRV